MISVSLDDVDFIGDDIQRGECILATKSGDIFLPDRRGGISIVREGRPTEKIMAVGAPKGFMPNGIALLPDRSFLMANLGPSGGVWHMSPDGSMRPRLLEVGGRRLEPTNFVGIDSKGRTWVSVSTRLVPREQAMKKGVADGYLVLIDARGARIVAEGFGFTNEAIVDPTGKWLYVNETWARRTSRLEILPDGSVGRRELFAQYGHGTYPDGFAFDEEGAVWTVSVVSNRVIRTTQDGTQQILFEDVDPVTLQMVEDAFEDGSYTRQHLDTGGTRRLGNISGIAFGGPDLKTVYLGSLFGQQVARFRSPVAGAKPIHWDF